MSSALASKTTLMIVMILAWAGQTALGGFVGGMLVSSLLHGLQLHFDLLHKPVGLNRLIMLASIMLMTVVSGVLLFGRRVAEYREHLEQIRKDRV